MSTEPTSVRWRGPLAISAVGASTCFGGITTAAAAARADLSRFVALADRTYIDDETHEATPVSGAAIVGVTDGFEGAGRLGRMSQIAVEELAQTANWLDVRRARGFLALPTLAESAARRVAASVARSLGASPDLVNVHPSGHAGTARAIREAGEALWAGRCDYAIVGACDSWLDPRRLSEIIDAGRLKTRNHPVGLLPGEAAVFLLLERPLADRGYDTLALLSDIREESEENGAPDKPPTGRALARAALAAIGQTDRGTLYVDINGETSRATDWAMAVTRIQATRRLDGFARAFPASSFGDTGTASPILAAALAARAFARGYAVGEKALVLSIGDGSERLALVVEKPGSAGKAARG